MNKVRFWPHKENKNTASFRLRCLRILEGLQDAGMDASLYKEDEAPTHLVLSKRYDAASLAQALSLRKNHGTKIFLDVCDNHFYSKMDTSSAIERANQFLTALQSVDEVIASSEYLARLIEEKTEDSKPVRVIGDIVELPPKTLWRSYFLHPRPWIELYQLKQALDRLGQDKRTRLVWFGIHGNTYGDGGMEDLKLVTDMLEAVNKTHPLSLTIISSSKQKFEGLSRDWNFNSYYLPWNLQTFTTAMKLHGTALIPIKLSPFTLAKTSNRVTTSLVHGLHVIADAIPSYVEYKDSISIGDWEKNLLEQVTDYPAPKKRQSASGFEDANQALLQKWISAFAG